MDYLENFPVILRTEVENLAAEDLEKIYRPGGWNIRQVVHHLVDSHMNLYIRLKRSLTEDTPHVTGYREDLWAEEADYFMNLENPLQLLSLLHARIVHIFRTMDPESYNKTYYHVGYKADYVLRNVLHLYRWHSEHHLEHIRLALKS